jgi:hypothetical protein
MRIKGTIKLKLMSKIKIDRPRYKNDPVYRTAILSLVEKRLLRKLRNVRKKLKVSVKEVYNKYGSVIRSKT